MPHSMTGYGKGENIHNDRHYTVEIKSVNHRYNDISVRLPRLLSPLESQVRNEIAGKIVRGKTEVYISLESFSSKDASVSLNTALADAYYEKLKILNERYGFQEPLQLSLITRLPDVLTPNKGTRGEDITPELWQGLQPALALAVENLTRMRRAEGEALRRDITEKGRRVCSMTLCIREIAPRSQTDYAERLRARVTEALKGVPIDEARILTEVTLYADKISVDEEVTRLLSHISQLMSILEQEGAIGRKLDFLVQEMNREANTIGSKANDLDIIKTVVELKNEIEKIREQVQNLE